MPSESFSDVMIRLIKEGRSLTDLVNIWKNIGNDELDKIIVDDIREV
jgi:predicted CopG family antitoxin